MIGGWTLDIMQTIFNYIVGSDKCDKRVGRIESGWSNVDDGGVCPGIESFPIHEQESFNSFSLHLLGSASIDTETRQAFACVLLLHFEELKAGYPDHRLIRKMNICASQCNLVEGKLSEWAINVKAMFDLDNGIFLPLEDVDANSRVRVRDMNEFMSKAAESLRTNEMVVNELRGAVHLVQQDIYAIRGSLNVALKCQLDRIEVKMDSILSHFSRNDDPVLNYLEEQLPHMIQNDIMVQSSPPTAQNVGTNSNLIHSYFTPMSGNVIQQPQPTSFLNERTMKSQTLSTVYFDWFMNERFKTVPEPNTPQKAVFTKIWKTIAHLKRFLPNGHTQHPKPTVTTDLALWNQNLGSSSRIVQTEAMAFLNSRGNQVKRRRIEPLFFANYKRFMAIDPDCYPSPLNITDLATPAEYQQDISAFRTVHTTTKSGRRGRSKSSSRRATVDDDDDADD